MPSGKLLLPRRNQGRSLDLLSIIGWVLAGLLLFVLVLLLLPLHTRVRFDGTLQVWCGLGPVSLRLFPGKKKPKTEREKAQAAEKKAAKAAKKAQKPQGPKQKITLEVICDYLRLGVQALGMMKRRLVVRDLTCHLKVASADAASTALLYGRIAAAVSALYPIFQRNLRLKRTDIAVDADFEGSKLEILADVTIAACPLRLLIAGVILLIRFLKIQKKTKQATVTDDKKGGKLHEQHQ